MYRSFNKSTANGMSSNTISAKNAKASVTLTTSYKKITATNYWHTTGITTAKNYWYTTGISITKILAGNTTVGNPRYRNI